jgi:hypothetical protein
MSYTRDRPTRDKFEREAKHTKESENWLNQISTSNRYIDLQEEENEAQQKKARPENTPKPHPVYITDTHTAVRANKKTAI